MEDYDENFLLVDLSDPNLPYNLEFSLKERLREKYPEQYKNESEQSDLINKNIDIS